MSLQCIDMALCAFRLFSYLYTHTLSPTLSTGQKPNKQANNDDQDDARTDGYTQPPPLPRVPVPVASGVIAHNALPLPPSRRTMSQMR